MATTVKDYRALLSGSSWWSSGTVGKSTFITYSFESASYEQVAGPSHSNAFRASFKPLTDAERAAARDALNQWGDASGIRFLEADPGRGDIRFATYDLGKDPTGSTAAGYAYYPSVELSAGNGDIADIGGDVYIDDQVAGYRSGDMAHVFVHEIGHALGLKHPFDGDVILDGDLDDTDHTVMSYEGYGPKLGPIDIAAIRYLYGGPASDGSHVAAWSWDAATDTLTQIGGNGADTIRGVASADVMRGAGGDDRLFGGSGDDRMEGGAGDDSLVGGDGDDLLDGGDGNDSIHGGDGHTTARGGAGDDWLYGGVGRDRLDGGSDDDNVNGYEGDDVLFGGAGSDAVSGWAGDDRAWGGEGDDTLTGDLGDDVLSGDAGMDILDGQADNDTLIGGAGNDWLSGGEGVDTADYSATTAGIVVAMSPPGEPRSSCYAKGSEIGYDQIFEVENIVGGSAADDIAGTAADNVLDGRGGADRLSGGAGNDTFLIDAARDRVVEARGEGRDTVLAAVSYTLAAGQEVEVLRFDASVGTARLSLRGNEFAQTLIGNSNANGLDGTLGNDVLMGGKGADTFVFSTKPYTGNCDRIADFASEDTIRLSKSIFAELTAGVLAETAFKNISAGTIDADDRILYRKTTGDLFYDPDGSGKLGAVKFALLDNKAVLTAADILVA